MSEERGQKRRASAWCTPKEKEKKRKNEQK